MFIWDFVANPVMDALMDWCYSQIIGFLGAFFAQMGNMGVELFDLPWVQAVALFFSQLGWALFGVSLVVCVFECEYSAGRANIQQTAINILKGFLSVCLFTTVPVRLYTLSVALQGTFAQGIAGSGGSIGEIGGGILAELEGASLLEAAEQAEFGLGTNPPLLRGAHSLRRDQGVLRQLEAGRHPAHPNRRGLPLYVLHPPWLHGRLHPVVQAGHWPVPDYIFAGHHPDGRAHGGLMVVPDHILLGLGLMLSAGEVPRIAGTFGLDTTTRANIMSAVYTAQAAVNTTRTIVQAVK